MACAIGSGGHVLGLDVGWSTVRRSSAACLLSWDDARVGVRIERFSARPEDYRPALAGLVGGVRLDAAAFDGPLRGDLEEIGTYRLAEAILTRRLGPLIGKPGQSSSRNGRLLNRMASCYARDLIATAEVGACGHLAAIHPRAIVEAFPTTFLGTMLDTPFATRRGSRSDAYYVALTGDPRGDRLGALIRRLLPGRTLDFDLVAVRNHDERAAVACAVTALCIAGRCYTAVGDSDGRIVLPPRAAQGIGLADWAWSLIAGNARTLGAELIEEAGLPAAAGAAREAPAAPCDAA